MKDIKVGLINLGCDKNRIDSEIMLGRMSKELILTNNIELKNFYAGKVDWLEKLAMEDRLQMFFD